MLGLKEPQQLALLERASVFRNHSSAPWWPSANMILSFCFFEMGVSFPLRRVLRTARSITAMVTVMVVSARPYLVLSLSSPPMATCAHLNPQRVLASRAEVLDMDSVELVPFGLRKPS